MYDVDPDIAAALRAAELEDARPLREIGPEELRRRDASTIARLAGPPVELAAVQEIAVSGQASGIAATRYRNKVVTNGPALIFIHGGGWVFGSRASHDPICRALASSSGVDLISLEYRLAPEHPFPAAIDDCWNATHHIVEHAAQFDLDPERIGVGGDSAGGNLAAAVALRARENGLRLACQYLLYPALDARCDTESYSQFADGYGLTHDEMKWFWSLYLPAAADQERPEASPSAAADLRALAPATVITAEHDVLRDEAETYARRLAQAGVPTTLWTAPKMTHAFLNYRGVSALVRSHYSTCARLLAASLLPLPADIRTETDRSHQYVNAARD